MEELTRLLTVVKELKSRVVDVEIAMIEELKKVSSREICFCILVCVSLVCVMWLSVLGGAVQGVMCHHFSEDTKKSLKKFYNQHEGVCS